MSEKSNPKPNGKISELGKKLLEIRRRIEADKNFVPLTEKQVKKEVEKRRTGNFNE